jgi:hypothetical protein
MYNTDASPLFSEIFLSDLSVNQYVFKGREQREMVFLPVEREVNGDSKSTNERGTSLVWLVGLVVPIKEIFGLPSLL